MATQPIDETHIEERPASRRRRPYTTGDSELDARIQELVQSFAPEAAADILAEMMMTIVRLGKSDVHRGELKLVNASLKEFVHAFRVFAPYRGVRKVSMFGSARVSPIDPGYQVAREFARRIVEHGWMVITGAGPGIMKAGHEGAGRAKSFGLNIRLPMEDSGGKPFLEADPKLINFRYFFTRKVTFLKESDAFVLLPGGFGTLDEAFELLTLVQTGKSDLHPVVLLEPAGSSYWREWLVFIEEHLAGRGLISMDDLELLTIVDDIDEAIADIEGFYRNYQSQRWVGDKLVLRMRRGPEEHQLAAIQDEFADILERGRFEVVEPLPAEAADQDQLELARLAFAFNRYSYGRLRALVNALNQL
jgi:uncharacterized protein (TIGR00730 family)